MVVDSPPGMMSPSRPSSSAGAADADAGGPGGLDGVQVLTEIALEGQDADPQACAHAGRKKRKRGLVIRPA